ncbi:gmc oxidoreductase [Colletotrichum musicola]|uniref:Gmc oxidoreductase n=1 Tax=Colletotrichum musicola TaxID=2175873 RepID=A0A8H6K7U7_9PEZI|nr:gmc oxidoreductase [Colletotrichum musicola]
MTGAGTKDVVKGGWPAGAEHHLYESNEDWQAHVKKYASTSYHPGGTCKLGREDDPMAVLDGEARVYGIRGLRIADCSIMPTLHSGHTQMPAYGIGELVAEFLQKEHGLQMMPK